MKFDDILKEIGEFGPYQKRVFYLMSLPIIISGIQMFSVLFTYDIPAYRCAIPGYPNDTYRIQNEAHASLINKTIPVDGDTDGGYSKCSVYSRSNHTSNRSNSSGGGEVGEGMVHEGMVHETRACPRRVFDRTNYEDTVVTEFDLVCGKEVMRSHANSVAFFGSFIGSVVLGALADILGRKAAIMTGVILELVSALMIYFTSSFSVILAARAIMGVGLHSMFAISATTGIELVGPNKRSFTGVVVEIYWTVGLMILLPTAYFIRGWRDLQLAIILATIPLLSLWWLVPESPRWLLSKERYAEVDVILHRICESNKTKIPFGALSGDHGDEEGASPAMSIWGMFTHRVLIIRACLIFFNWFAVNLFYYGLTLNMSNLEGDPYLNFLFGALVEVAAYLFCLPVIERVSRLKFHCTCMCVGGLACLGVIPCILLDANPLVINILSLIGRFCSSCCYTVLYILSAELFPTVLRNSGIGFCSIFESLGGICSPYIADMGVIVGGRMSKGIPMIVFGGITVCAGCLSLFLPETLHKTLPETIQDAIEFGRKKSKTEKTDVYYPLAESPNEVKETPFAA